MERNVWLRKSISLSLMTAMMIASVWLFLQQNASAF